ncbi:MAG: HlyC/CorC family transporter [Rhodobacteraceae bacterium]|nr:HlyC/CorC family transporter [Paracoccaceae bacterium]
MGDTEGSSNAAQSALAIDANEPRETVSFWQRLFGGAKTSQHIATDLDAGTEAGSRAIQVNLQNLRNRRIDAISVPKTDIIAVSEDSTRKEVVDAFRSSTLTRLPVYHETLDEPVGLVHLKDLALKHGFGNGVKFDLAALLRPLIYAPPSMPIGVLLQKMQSEHIHMALVIDEYGGVDGLVTIEDLLEQIVGDIIDEHDEEEQELWVEESPGVYLAHARAELRDIEEVAGVDLLPDDLDEEIDTLGGIVVMLAGRVPIRGEVVRDDKGNEFEVIEADPRRIKRLRVTFAPRAA